MYASIGVTSVSFLLKHANKIFLCPGLSPSQKLGMDLKLSAIENYTNSLWTKSLYLRFLMLWSTNKSGS